jgi:hypothetical protein
MNVLHRVVRRRHRAVEVVRLGCACRAAMCVATHIGERARHWEEGARRVKGELEVRRAKRTSVSEIEKRKAKSEVEEQRGESTYVCCSPRAVLLVLLSINA